MTYAFYIYDYVTEEENYYCDFEALQSYINVYCDRLNEENQQQDEPYRYACNSVADVLEICEVSNIRLEVLAGKA